MRPFAWNYYMGINGDATGDLNSWDLAIMTTWPKYAGAEGVVWWGAPWYAGTLIGDVRCTDVRISKKIVSTTH